MSWLFSQAQAAASSVESYSDGEPFAPLNVIYTPQPFYSKDKPIKSFHRSPFGQTYQVSQSGTPIAKKLLKSFADSLRGLSLAVDSHAKTFPVQEQVQDSQEAAADFGVSSPALLAKYDPPTHSLKTLRCSGKKGLSESCVTLPRWGMMQNGACSELPMSERLTSESESGLKQLSLFPTPCASDGTRGGSTPTRGYNRVGLSPTSGDGLATFVRNYPTPTAHMAKETNAPSETTRNQPSLTSLVSGGQKTPRMTLNPAWVEWLMGWCIGWTDLEPLEMDKFQSWRQLHGGF